MIEDKEGLAEKCNLRQPFHPVKRRRISIVLYNLLFFFVNIILIVSEIECISIL